MSRWLVVSAHDAENPKNGSALRVRQHLERLKKQGHEVRHFRVAAGREWASMSLLDKAKQAPRIAVGMAFRLDPNCTFLFIKKDAERLESEVRGFRPEWVVFCESWLFPYHNFLLQVAAHGKPYGFWWHQVIDLHNVESRLRSRTSTARAVMMYRAEKFLVGMSDETWVCSLVDAGNVQELYGRRATVIPNKVDAARYESVPRCESRRFGMVGIWSYRPNEEAGRILLDLVHPFVADSTLVLAGKNPAEWMKRPAVEVTGEVEDTRDVLGNLRTVVVPLLEGGGTRMKILEAMAAGVPVIATPKAVEGLEITNMMQCVICQPWEMAKRIEFLWSHPSVEEHLRTNARALVQQKYSW